MNREETKLYPVCLLLGNILHRRGFAARACGVVRCGLAGACGVAWCDGPKGNCQKNCASAPEINAERQ